MTKHMTIKILNTALFFKILNRLDEGSPGSRRISENVWSGNFDGVLNNIKESFEYIISQDGLKDLLQDLVKVGAIEIVAGFLPIKKSVTFGNLTIAL